MTPNKQFNFSIIFIIIICSYHQQCEGFSGYGEFCNKTIRCVSSAYLSCQNEVCKCIKQDSMIYDTNIKQCVVLAGEKCRYTVGNNIDQFWYETVNCVEFAICDGESGICNCLPNFIDHKNGTCSEKGGFNTNCQINNDCRFDLALSCINNTCQCDTNKSIDSFIAFGNNFTRQCVGLAGKSCIHHKCTLNAHCPDEIYFTPDSRPICQCIPPYTPTSKGLCLAGHGYPCSNFNPCSNSFVCIDQRCQCKNPTNQIFDQYTGMCKSLVWGPCDKFELDESNNESKNLKGQCIDGATCVKNKLNDLNYCECDKDFIENNQGECDLAYGSSCDGLMFKKCDQVAPLSCRSGKCICLDDQQMYDPLDRKCKGLVGSVCSTSDSCIKNAVCQINLDSFGRPGGRKTCSCPEGMKATQNQTCG